MPWKPLSEEVEQITAILRHDGAETEPISQGNDIYRMTFCVNGKAPQKCKIILRKSIPFLFVLPLCETFGSTLTVQVQLLAYISLMPN